MGEEKIFQSFVDTLTSALVICPFLLGHGWTKGIAAICKFVKGQCKEKKTADKEKCRAPTPVGFYSYIFRLVTVFWIFGLLFLLFYFTIFDVVKYSAKFLALIMR